MIKVIKSWFSKEPNNSISDKGEPSYVIGKRTLTDMESTQNLSFSEEIEENSVEEVEGDVFFPPFSAAKHAKPLREQSHSENLSTDRLVKRALLGEHNEVFKKALALCVQKRRASIPVLQHGLSIGYEDALALLDKMTEQELIGNARGERPRLIMNLAFETVGLWEAQAVLDSETEDEEINGADLRRDEKYEEAIRIVIEMGRASTAVLQRRLRIGYGRAASIMDMMHHEGIVGAEDGSKPREVLVKSDFLERLD
jgi:DNA segregation ATPase FtsK/SpoIIIE-like protein